MKVTRINSGSCSFAELTHGESDRVRAEIRSKLSYPDRGQRSLPPPLKRMKGTASRLKDLYFETELLLRYTSMSENARRALIRSIWRTMEKSGVTRLEAEVPWGHTHTRDIVVYWLPIEGSREFFLRLTLMKQ